MLFMLIFQSECHHEVYKRVETKGLKIYTVVQLNKHKSTVFEKWGFYNNNYKVLFCLCHCDKSKLYSSILCLMKPVSGDGNGQAWAVLGRWRARRLVPSYRQ